MFSDIPLLIERCIQKDEKAWAEFIGKFWRLLCYSAQERLRKNAIEFSSHDIEDIVQGVVLEIWENNKLEEVKDRKKVTAWLSIMAQTRALNYFRNRKNRLLSKDELFMADNIESDAGNSIDEEVVSKLEDEIEKLSPRDRIILKLNILHNKKHKYIAKFMGIPVNTVSTVIARNKKNLKDKLKDTL
jgi:RNA polymerase sigma-70 factor (ECF subfamily)